MSNNPITKVARNGFDARTADDKDLSFSSEWKTPKIFIQTSSLWTNTIGYPPSFMSFRQINSTDFTHDSLIDFDTDATKGTYVNYQGDIVVNKRSGDVNMFAIGWLEPLEGTPPENYSLEEGGVFLLGSGDVEVRTAFPTDNSVDTRFDTFKIFKTGTLELNLPQETLFIGAADRVYTATVEHDLGYPPVYLPMATVGWDLGDSGVAGSSFVVNDVLGYLLDYGLSGRAILDVYVDSEKLYMTCTRKSNDFYDVNFNAVTITMYYTIFYNEIGEEFNLLNDEYK